MIKHLLYNFRVVINNHSVLKALKEAICSVLLLVIVLPSIIYAGKDYYSKQENKLRCCTYDQQFCYPLVKSKCIKKEKFRYQNPDILQKKIQLLESSAKQAWNNAQNHQFSSNIEKLNAVTNAGTQTREIISLSEQLKKALVNEGKARWAAFEESSKTGKGKIRNRKDKDFQQHSSLLNEQRAALKLAQEFGNKASGQYKIIKASARDLVVVAGLDFWNALLLYKKIDEELDSKVRNDADKKSILIAKKKVLYEIEKVLKAFVEGRDMYNTFMEWVIDYSGLTEEKEKNAIEFLLQNRSYNTVRRSASFETTLKAVIEIYKNGDFINGLKLQNESVKTDIAKIEHSIRVAEDEMRRKQEEEKAKKLLELQNKLKKAKEEVDAAKDKFKEKQTQAREAHDQASASGDLEDKIEALNKKKKEYEAAKKYKEALDKAIDIGNNNPDLVRERDSLGNDIDNLSQSIDQMTDDVNIDKEIYKQQFEEDKNSSVSANCDFSQYRSISPESSVFTLASFVYQNINFKCGNVCNTEDKGFNLCLKVKKSDLCRDCIPIYIGPQSEFKSIRKLFDTSGVKKGRRDPILVTENAVKNIGFKVEHTDKISCLKIKTSYGDIPIVCKNISTDIDLIPQARSNNRICSLSTTKSRVPFNFSGRAIGCLKEALDKMFYADSITHDQVSSASILKPLSSFQRGMTLTVKAALMLYIIFFGIKMIFVERFFSLERLVTGVLQILIVMYFSVGLGPMTNKDGKISYNNGMQDHFLPFLSSVTSELAHMVFSSVGSDSAVGGTKLCYFDPNKDYTPDARYYALWDAIDCRIGYYLGFRLLHNYTVDRSKPSLGGKLVGSSIGTSANDDITKHLSNIKDGHALKKDDTFLVFPTLWGLLLSGEIIFFLVMLLFVIIFLTLFWRFMAVFITSLVNLYVMCYISPIFIPMVLFEKTKSMFNNWLHLTLSFALQPAIVAAFIALFVTLMDSITYKTCQFARYDYQQGNKILSTFELRVPDRYIQDHSLFDDAYNSDAAKICRESAGYRLVEYFNGKNWHQRMFLFFKAFVVYPEPDFLPTMIVVLLFCGIFYYFFQEAHRFAAVITSGITAVNMELPSLRIPSFRNKSTRTKGGKDDKEEEASDKFSSRGGIDKTATDKISSRSNIESSSQDKISTGLKSNGISGVEHGLKKDHDAIRAAKKFDISNNDEVIGADKFSTSGNKQADKLSSENIKPRDTSVVSAEDKFSTSFKLKDHKDIVQSEIDKKLESNVSDKSNSTSSNQTIETRKSNIESDALSKKIDAKDLNEINKGSDDKKNI